MPQDLVLKIAAGEVVERPASAVKELIDNAVDAGARQIKVAVRDAGLNLIHVSDNGVGIPRNEVRLAFQSHATSKIAAMDDLDRLTTLGFRGEALASIAAVAHVEVQTRTAGETAGVRFEIEHGRVLSEKACSATVGTRISVGDLFANVPARRKFVRSLRAEAGQITSVVMQYALAQPSIQFNLTIDNRQTFESPGTDDLGAALAAVYGTDLVPNMHPVDVEDSRVRIQGLISAPGTTRSNRTSIHIFVNGRPVQNRSLSFALAEAYSGFLMVGRHPVAVIHLGLPPEDVDPNIHPSKSEVRFARDREVHGILHRAVANTLLELRLSERGGGISLPSEEVGGSFDVALPLVDGGSGPTPDVQPSLLPDVPALRVFGQTAEAFIIAEGPQGLYMIDQHAAHERVLFDRLDEQLSGDSVASQPLLEPTTVHLEPAQMLALEENKELLIRTGFQLEAFGTNVCLIRAVPALARGGAPAELVAEVLRELENIPEPAAARERALAAMACKAAVKAGQTLSVGEMRELVTQLEHTVRPATCPHGRPTMIHLSHMQLEKEFGRR